MNDVGPCSVCETQAKQKCSGCQNEFYCGRDHQKQHWKQHKMECSPTKIKEDKILGRYLVATKNINPGDVVKKEKPIITGPSQVSPPVCLGCYAPLDSASHCVCERCGWPMCSPACARAPHHEPECHYTAARGIKPHVQVFGEPHPMYQCITVLRCLYQRDRDPKIWSKLQNMESHSDDRRNTEKWNSDKNLISDFIRNFFNLQDVFSEEEIMKCCGIVQINAHEVPLSEVPYIALYDKISMIEHNCRANCAKSFTSSGELLLSAAVPVKRNEHLSICYTDSLWGTEARRHHLAETKYFECQCDRCKDVTELGSMFSAVKCQSQNCKSGYLLPESFIYSILVKKIPKIADKDNANGVEKIVERSWTCNSCNSQVADVVIQKMLDAIGRDLNEMTKDDSEACERFIEHCGKYLHPHHYYMTDVGLALAQIIGQEKVGALAAVSDDQIKLKSQLCTSIADLVEIIAPAEVRGRGSLLFELHAAITEIGRRKSLKQGPGALVGYVTESHRILVEAIRLLQHEPEELPEGKVAKQARINLLQMEDLLAKMSSVVSGPI